MQVQNNENYGWFVAPDGIPFDARLITWVSAESGEITHDGSVNDNIHGPFETKSEAHRFGEQLGL
jgi:hypothetical protein